MKHRNKQRRLEVRQRAYNEGPRDPRERARWEHLKATKGIRMPGSMSK